MFSNMFNSNPVAKNNSMKPSFKFADSSISWEEIDAKLRVLESVNERIAFDSSTQGRGYSSHKANIRLFDAPDGYTPEVTLYRDTAGWCPYCEKGKKLLRSQ
jgi:glutathione S-transferase